MLINYIMNKLNVNGVINNENIEEFSNSEIAISSINANLSNSILSERLTQNILNDINQIINPTTNENEDFSNTNLCNKSNIVDNYLSIDDLAWELLKGRMDLGPSGIGNEERIYSFILFNNSKVLSIAYYYIEGSGAHENEHLIFSNYDLVTGDKICAPDLFKNGYKKTLCLKAIKILKRIYTNNESLNDEINEEDNIDYLFSITPIGLLFHFNDYGLHGGGWNMNRPDFVISYKELEDIINPTNTSIKSILAEK